MQMVGATKKFIRRPFIFNNIRLGALGALLAIAANLILLYYINLSFPELKLTQQPLVLGMVFITIFIVGIFITWISTYFATQRFLNLKTDQLYF
jgi:cell division transport system permease protein